MTTEVIINAICTENKVVVVQTKEDGEDMDEITLEDGDSETFYVYDKRVISIFEEDKE